MEIVKVDAAARPMVFVEARCTLAPHDIGKVMEAAFATLGAFLASEHVVPSGPPLAIYSDWDGNTIRARVGFPVREAELTKASPPVLAGETPGGVAYKAVHHGSYAGLHQTYAALETTIRADGKDVGDVSWEVYYNEPGVTPEDELVTEVFMLPKAA